MMQELAVFAIVGLAASYAAWKLMPRALRARLAYATAGWAQRRGRLSDTDAAALASRLTGSGCGDCKSCGSCSSAPKSATLPARIGIGPGKGPQRESGRTADLD
jgi:hypothetical protein